MINKFENDDNENDKVDIFEIRSCVPMITSLVRGNILSRAFVNVNSGFINVNVFFKQFLINSVHNFEIMIF